MISLAFFHGKWYNIREIINSRLEDAMYMDFTVKIPDVTILLSATTIPEGNSPFQRAPALANALRMTLT